MSPRKMFHSCGNSSIAVARMNRPMRVTRGSCSVACNAPIGASASGRIERNFSAVNGRPPSADALLREEDRAAVLELDRRGERSPTAAPTQQAGAGQRDVERPLHAASE